jgi:hypothetical protein
MPPEMMKHYGASGLGQFVFPPLRFEVTGAEGRRPYAHTHTVLSEVETVFLGRDFLNASAELMAREGLTVAAESALVALESPAVVVRSEAYWQRVRSAQQKAVEGTENDPSTAMLLLDRVALLKFLTPAASGTAELQPATKLLARSLPLDVLRIVPNANGWQALEHGRAVELPQFFATPQWSFFVDVSTGRESRDSGADPALLPLIAQILDPLTRHPLWLSQVAFFPSQYQVLTFALSAERFGLPTVGAA